MLDYVSFPLCISVTFSIGSQPPQPVPLFGDRYSNIMEDVTVSNTNNIAKYYYFIEDIASRHCK